MAAGSVALVIDRASAPTYPTYRTDQSDQSDQSPWTTRIFASINCRWFSRSRSISLCAR